ncbi:MAG: dienelactone hydrolase family protein, partial [Candidatus Limnocylindria bacterium]
PDGATLLGYEARPRAGGRYAGVVVIQENRGLLEHIKDVTRRVATAGFAAVSVDLLSRQGGAERLSDGAAYAAELTRQSPAALDADLRAALDHLRGQPYVNGDALGTVGFCFGGGMVWSLVASGAALRAAVPFYGPPPAQLDALGSTRTNVFAVYAERDTRITDSRQQVEERLRRSGTPYQITVYPGVDHAFHNDTGARYNAEQAQRAWADTLAWLGRFLA